MATYVVTHLPNDIMTAAQWMAAEKGIPVKDLEDARTCGCKRMTDIQM
jgi:hypothetical protein